MGRTLPGQCIHGYIYDWGDFGVSKHSMPEKCHHGCNDVVLATWQRGHDAAGKDYDEGFNDGYIEGYNQ